MQSYIFIQYGYLSLFVKQARNEFLSKVVVALQTLRYFASFTFCIVNLHFIFLLFYLAFYKNCASAKYIYTHTFGNYVCFALILYEANNN